MRSIERAHLIGVNGVTEVLLIRHGDVYQDNADALDPPLSALGRQQATKLAARLTRIELGAVYASPLKRALETARALRQDVIVEPGLAEVQTRLNGSRILVTETREKIVGRMAAAVDKAVEKHAGQRIAMVGHGVAILHYLSYVMRLNYEDLRLYPHFTGINVVRILGDRRMVGSLADIAHLEAG
jgi:probable phosphoglycerate mutase